MNTKLHGICDSKGRPLNVRHRRAGQRLHWRTGAIEQPAKVGWLLADRGYDADWLRQALKDKGLRARVPGRKQRTKAVKHDKRRYKRRNCIEIMFGRLKDWRRVATRYDRCPKVFLSAIALAAVVIYWL
jgi:transposase